MGIWLLPFVSSSLKQVACDIKLNDANVKSRKRVLLLQYRYVGLSSFRRNRLGLSAMTARHVPQLFVRTLCLGIDVH